MEPALKDDFQFNILVVDDDAHILSLMKEILSMVPGSNIITAANAKEAMPYVVKGNIDIIFTDIHMPNHSGLEFLQDLVTLEQTPEVIIMTAHPNGENALQAMELGAMSLLAKPFDDISVVEAELQKAIKRVIRQRAVDKEVLLKKMELSAKQASPPDEDPSMRISLPAFPDAPVPPSPEGLEEISIVDGDSSGASDGLPEKSADASAARVEVIERPERKLYSLEILDPLVEIEVARFARYKRQFAIGYIDLPEVSEAKTPEQKRVARENQLARLEKIVRRSDVLMDGDRDGIVVVAFECNKVGTEVLDHKLRAKGFEFSGFAVHPSDGSTGEELRHQAKLRLHNKRKLQVLMFEQEEFFGRLVHNMLLDPKYHLTWAKSLDELYRTALAQTEEIKLLIVSLSRDKEVWKVLARMLKEGLVRWPILLFVDVPLTPEVKVKLSKLGVRAIVNKSASQEEFIYLVQSFVIPKPFGKERKNYRALAALPVSYKKGGEGHASNSFTLSRDGLFIRDLNPPASGEVLDIEIFTPNAGVMRTRVEVLYAVPYFVGVGRFHVAGFAVRFLDLTPVQRDQLEAIVASSLTSYLL